MHPAKIQISMRICGAFCIASAKFFRADTEDWSDCSMALGFEFSLGTHVRQYVFSCHSSHVHTSSGQSEEM